MSLADDVREVRERVAARLSELEPLAHEYQELLRLAEELGIPHDAVADPAVAPPGAAEVSSGSSSSVDPGAQAAAAAKPARRRRRSAAAESSEGTRTLDRGALAADPDPERDARVIETLRTKPGITIAELASILGLPATSLYRPVRELTSSGAVVKRGRGLYAES